VQPPLRRWRRDRLVDSQPLIVVHAQALQFSEVVGHCRYRSMWSFAARMTSCERFSTISNVNFLSLYITSGVQFPSIGHRSLMKTLAHFNPLVYWD
jgi:hypothetical protein